ncbi:MAG: tyrosine-type recombinase/integrase [Actinobacteria bacterium]|jgi:site-specific recombinase XerD|nr:tyrosine-type recombinase/integrase [Actinomycetota bacterium]MCA1697537.1 tyrosine-type recombinase/integrase [Actinomycetota bacterium]
MEEVDDRFGAAVAAYETWLARQPLASSTKREYRRWVRAFAAWAVAAVEREEWGGDPLVDPLARDYAARDFKRWLQVERRLAPRSVNLGLASLDSFFTVLGLGQPRVRRELLPQAAPRALDQAAQRQLLRAAERASARDRALVGVMLFTALRISEAVALDLEDLRISARKGEVAVRSGKGDAGRTVPLNAVIRDMLKEWLDERQALECEQAVFVTRRGERLSARSADDAVRKVAADAHLQISAHVLRHTCLTNLVRGGEDLVMVAELAGHRRLDTTRRYSLPSQADRQAAMDRLQSDY